MWGYNEILEKYQILISQNIPPKPNVLDPRLLLNTSKSAGSLSSGNDKEFKKRWKRIIEQWRTDLVKLRDNTWDYYTEKTADEGRAQKLMEIMEFCRIKLIIVNEALGEFY